MFIDRARKSRNSKRTFLRDNATDLVQSKRNSRGSPLARTRPPLDIRVKNTDSHLSLGLPSHSEYGKSCSPNGSFGESRIAKTDSRNSFFCVDITTLRFFSKEFDIPNELHSCPCRFLYCIGERNSTKEPTI